MSTGETDFQKAHTELVRYVLETERPQGEQPEAVYLASVLLGYYGAYGKNLPSAKTCKKDVDRFNAFWAGYLVSKINHVEQKRYVDHRISQKVKPSTIDRELSTLRAAFRRSLTLGELTTVPVVKAIETANDRRSAPPRGRPLVMAEMAALLNAAKTPRTRLFVLMLANLMCRPGAAIELTKAQVDLENDLVTLNPEGRKQTKKYRPIVKLTKTLKLWLENWPAERYMAYGDQKVTTAKNIWRRLSASAGLTGRINSTSIRHTMARELRKRRVPGEQIELMLGHRLPDEITQVYAPYDPDYCVDAAAAIEAYMGELQKLVTTSLTGPVIAASTSVNIV